MTLPMHGQSKHMHLLVRQGENTSLIEKEYTYICQKHLCIKMKFIAGVFEQLVAFNICEVNQKSKVEGICKWTEFETAFFTLSVW